MQVAHAGFLKLFSRMSIIGLYFKVIEQKEWDSKYKCQKVFMVIGFSEIFKTLLDSSLTYVLMFYIVIHL